MNPISPQPVPLRRIIRPALQPRWVRQEAVADLDRGGRLLGPLHAASRVLARFESIDAMLAELFAVVAQALPLRSVVLVEDRSGQRRLRSWCPAGAAKQQLARAERHARLTHDYLARLSPVNLSLGIEDGARRLARPKLREPAGCIALPLVADDGSVFGIFQAQPAVRVGEPELAFLDAVCGALAVSLDRHYSFRHEVELRQRAEALARENARLYREAQQAIGARERLLAFVSHDLKTPLSAITLCVSTLLSCTPQVERRRGRRQLDAIARCTERMKHLVHDLVDAASIDAGKLSLRRSRQPVAPLVADALRTVQPLAAEQRLDLAGECPRRSDCELSRSRRCPLETEAPAECEVEGALDCGFAQPLAVEADRERVVQVLVNLLGNAIKFTGERGRVRVAVRAEGRSVRFSVHDSGPGIEKRHQRHLFEQFWRSEDTRREGHGLGLYICRGIVEAHGGKIWAESKKGRGSSFHFTLPAAPSGPVEARPGRRRGGGVRRSRIRPG